MGINGLARVFPEPVRAAPAYEQIRRFKHSNDSNHEADVAAYALADGLPGSDVLLKPADLARRWRTTTDALRKQRGRGTGPCFLCLSRRQIRYRLLDVVNYEANRVAYSVHQARMIGLL
jgi:hypothetical protein